MRVSILSILTVAGWAFLASHPDWDRECTGFLAGYGVLFALCVAATLGFLRRPATRSELALVWLVALAARAVLLTGPLVLSDDLYRYVWDGRVFLEGINPYRFPPDSPALAHLRDGLWPHINNPSLVTIYPPVLMAVFAGAAALSPTVLGFKAVFVLFDLAAGFCLQRALGPDRAGRVVAYLWCPLVVVEIAGQGHADAVGLFLVAAALWATAGRRWLAAGGALTAASLVKFLPVVALPALVRRLGWRWLLLPAAAYLVYLPFREAGVDPLGSLGTFTAKWRSNDFLFGFLHQPTVPSEPGLEAAKRTAGLIAAGVWLLVLLLRRPWYSVYSWTVGTVLLLSPVVHPWYVLWLLPTALFLPHVAWWTWTATVVLAYAALPGLRETGAWTGNPVLPWIQYAPVLALVPVQAVLEIRAALSSRTAER